jgi:hypothetical protein
LVIQFLHLSAGAKAALDDVELPSVVHFSPEGMSYGVLANRRLWPKWLSPGAQTTRTGGVYAVGI